MLKEHMEKMNEDWGLVAPLLPTSSGVWRIPVEEVYEVHISSSEDKGILFSADVAQVPNSQREKCFQMLLSANLFGQGTNALAIIGMASDTGKVRLQAIIPTDSNYDFFSGTLEEFINLCDYWRDEVLTL